MLCTRNMFVPTACDGFLKREVETCSIFWAIKGSGRGGVIDFFFIQMGKLYATRLEIFVVALLMVGRDI